MGLHVPFLGSLSAPLLLALWSAKGPLRRSPWPAVVAIVLFGRAALLTALANVRAPAQWDYGSFWLYGRVAAAHGNFYEPAVIGHVALPFVPGADFLAAVSNVGFPYPPPTMMLFLPLGYIADLSTGLRWWYGAQFIALVGAAWVLARALMRSDGWPAVALVLAVALALPATHDTVVYAQTNFLLLLLTALAFAGRGKPWGAVWQLLAVWVKPYTIVLFLVDIVRVQWRRLGAAAITAVLSLAAATALFGLPTVLTYVASNPAAREPAFTFYESVNQSLLAAVLRAQHPLPTQVSLLKQPIYLALAFIAVAISVALIARVRRSDDLPFAIALLLGLLVYPATLASYGVLLVLPLFILWSRSQTLPGGAAAVVALTALVTVLQGPLHFALGANAVVWLYAVGALAVANRGVSAAAVADLAVMPSSARGGIGIGAISGKAAVPILPGKASEQR